MLTIHLAEKRDEVDCLSAWVSAKEADFPTQDGVDLKSKYRISCAFGRSQQNGSEILSILY